MKQFWYTFIVLIGLFLIGSNTDYYQQNIESRIASIYAEASSGILNLLQQETYVDHTRILGKNYSLVVSKGCDAVLPIALLVIAILSFPYGNRKSKIKGLGFGILLLIVLNIIRIVSLYYVGMYSKTYFEFFHVEFWQVVFIIITVLYFLIWVLKKTN